MRKADVSTPNDDAIKSAERKPSIDAWPSSGGVREPAERTGTQHVTASYTDRASLAVRIACSGPVDLATLGAIDRLLIVHPDAIDLRFARACLLEELGRPAKAKRAYAEILEREPAHLGALLNSATMAYVDGRTTEALTLYRRAVAAHPDDATAHVNVGHALADTGAPEQGRAHYERALALEPDHAIAHLALARLLEERADPAAAAHRARAFAAPIVHVEPSTRADPLRLLVPIAAHGGNLVTSLLFDPRDVEATTLVVESYRAGDPLPAHDAIVNAIADPDRGMAALSAAEAIVAASGRPCINAPHAVRATGRIAVAERLAGIAGVVVPRIAAFAREDLGGQAVADAGFTYPLLLRAPGFHAGRYFVRVNAEHELAAQRELVPGDVLFAIAFVDTRIDGRFRKYRMLTIDGRLVPLHVAFARRWKVHYFSGDNAHRAASRELEAAFLADPRAHLGARAYAALERVAGALGLDYGGIDFTLDADGNVVVFEANASFAIYLPDDDATAVYRGPATERALHAVRGMIRERALRGRELVRKHRSLDDGEHLGPP